MGKATILSGGTDGLYSVKIDTGQATKTARLAAISARQVQLATELDNAQNALSVQQVIEAMAEAPVAAAIEAYVATTRVVPVVPADVKAALASYTKLSEKLQAEKRRTAPLRANVQLLLDEQTRLAKEAATWTALTLEETASAWCADLTTDASGAVATIEIPGENKLVLLAPAAPAPTAEDGVLTAREVQSGPQAFWNAAVLPGWQKWLPTYRRGTITAIQSGANTADVTLFAGDTSSAQALGINQTPTLTNVPVQYMTCNAAVFAVGDVCVVKFTNRDWAQPKIVGFVDHPKACALMLSGVVRGGALVGVVGSPGVYTLDAFKPTPNCWQYPLRSNPAKSPSAFALEPMLGRAGAQYASISPASYSGLMAQVVAALMGQGYVVPYTCTFVQTHGITLASDGTRWLVEISQARGALATRLAVAPAPADSTTDAVRECQALLGGLPTGAPLPSGAALDAALAAGTVLQLAPAADFAAYFAHSAYVPWLGWSISDTGAEWHNTCHRSPAGAETTLFGCHYKVLVSITKNTGTGIYSGTAALSLVAEGPLSINIDNGPRIPFEFGAAVGGFNILPPSTLVSGVDTPSTTPLFVCHQQGALQVINLEITARDDFDEEWVYDNPSGASYPWADYAYTSQSNRGGRRVYSAEVSTRDGTAIKKGVAKVVYRFAVTHWIQVLTEDGWMYSQAPYTTIGVHFDVHRWVDRGAETIVNPRHARDAYVYIHDVSDENHAFFTKGSCVDVADWIPPPTSDSETELDFMPADATLVPGYTDTNANRYKYSFVDYFVQAPRFVDETTQQEYSIQLTRIYPNYQHAGGVDLTVYSRHAPPRTVDLVADTALGTAEEATRLDVEESAFGATPQMIFGNALSMRGTGPDCAGVDFGAASSGTPYKLIGYLA